MRHYAYLSMFSCLVNAENNSTFAFVKVSSAAFFYRAIRMLFAHGWVVMLRILYSKHEVFAVFQELH